MSATLNPPGPASTSKALRPPQRLETGANGIQLTPEEFDAIEDWNEDYTYELSNVVLSEIVIEFVSKSKRDQHRDYVLKKTSACEPASKNTPLLPGFELRSTRCSPLRTTGAGRRKVHREAVMRWLVNLARAIHERVRRSAGLTSRAASCSYCQRSYCIAGPVVEGPIEAYICEECCLAVRHESMGCETSGYCSFCHRDVSVAGVLVPSSLGSTRICAKCIELSLSIFDAERQRRTAPRTSREA